MPETDLDLIRDAALEAGRIAMRFFRNDPEVWDKGGAQGPVTEADLAIDAMLSAELQRARPDYGWLSEESEDGAARLGHERVFIVDPIDGTRSFVEGQTPFAQVIAVAEAGKVTHAVVHLPAKDLTYAAALGEGASCNGAVMRVSDNDAIEGADVLAAKTNLAAFHWDGPVPEVTRHFRPSLAYRMGLVAVGRFDAMLTFRDAWEWDVAAGTLLIEEAGGRVSDMHGDALRYNNPHPQVPGILAGNPGLHAALLARRSRTG